MGHPRSLEAPLWGPSFSPPEPPLKGKPPLQRFQIPAPAFQLDPAVVVSAMEKYLKLSLIRLGEATRPNGAVSVRIPLQFWQVLVRTWTEPWAQRAGPRLLEEGENV